MCNIILSENNVYKRCIKEIQCTNIHVNLFEHSNHICFKLSNPVSCVLRYIKKTDI